MKRIRFTALYAAVTLLYLCLFSSGQAQAQTPEATPEATVEAITLDGTHVTADGTFRFQYPTDWTLHERDDGQIVLSSDPLTITIDPPSILAKFIGSSTLPDSADAVLAQWIGVSKQLFQWDVPTKIKLAPNVEGVQASFTSDDSRFAGLTAAFSLVLPVDDTFVMVTGATKGGSFAELEAALYPIAVTFEAGKFDQPGAVTGDLPTLRHYAGDDIGGNSEQAIAELEDLKLIPQGGEQVYAEEFMMAGLAPGFRLLEKTASDNTDFVMAGLISYEAVEKGDTGICGLVTRAATTTSGDVASFLMVGATSSNTVLVIEQGAVDPDPFYYETPVVAEFHNPTHLLYIVRGDQLTVFVNGEAVIENLPLKFAPDGMESLRAGTALDRGCVVTGGWAYGLPS